MISQIPRRTTATTISNFRQSAKNAIAPLPEQAIDFAAALLSHEQKPHRVTGGLLMALLWVAVGTVALAMAAIDTLMGAAIAHPARNRR